MLLGEILLWVGTAGVVTVAYIFVRDAINGIRIYRHDRHFTLEAIEKANPQQALLLRELFNRRYPKRPI